MAHWADKYVGSRAVGDRPCWYLVRQVWIDRLGFTLPLYDGTDSADAIAANEKSFKSVPHGQEREHDAVMMRIPVKDSSDRGFRSVEGHIGVVVSVNPLLVLHVEEKGFAKIEPMKKLPVSRVMRGPWGGQE